MLQINLYNPGILSKEILIDNIGDILKRFNDDEEHRFREILMTD
jgi:hypothetical protein